MRTFVLMVLSAAFLVVTVDSAQAAPGDPNPGSLDRLVELVADRLDTGDVVAAAKWVSAAHNGSEPMIDDPAREAMVYDAMTRLGADRGLSENWVRQVFSGQIEANKMVQRGLITRWRFDPAVAPTVSPELAAVRPEIDRLNIGIIEQLADHRAELSGPACAERLAHSVFDLYAARRGDGLHRVVLARAAAALCSP
ncbi:gamma subclass chorismate mutase AroQ [Nocardia sp. NPDC052566]|uniref:gamma subclass chorismate mutase AroQ n=1 Tax=Nocardia sp. NPDC052566 TaxID=3364330 RepID=UPI0037C73881